MIDEHLSELLHVQSAAVSVLFDAELRRLYNRRFSDRIRRFAVAEALMRGWLERTPSHELNGQFLEAADLGVDPLLETFDSKVRYLRDEYPRQTSVIEAAKRASPSTEWQRAWKYLLNRLGHFCSCDGIFAAADGAEAFAVPFHLKKTYEQKNLVDQANQQIPGWRSEVEPIWEVLGIRHKVTLGCWFGLPKPAISAGSAVRNGALEAASSITRGGSFALPVLFALSRTDGDLDPLRVLSTGGVRLGSIQGVTEIVAKSDLATRMGAVFCACAAEGERIPDGDIVLIDEGENLESSLSKIWKKAAQHRITFLADGVVEQRISKCLGRMRDNSDVNRTPRHLGAARKWSEGIVGRTEQIESFARVACEQWNSSQSRPLWIQGEHGCGKTTFAAALALKLADDGVQVVTHFFRDEHDLDKALQSAADTLSDLNRGLDLSGTAADGGAGRLQAALADLLMSHVSLKEHRKPTPRVAFVFDALDEVQGDLAVLAKMQQSPSIVWILTSIPPSSSPPLEKLYRDLSPIELRHHGDIGLGRLSPASAAKWLDRDGSDLPRQVREQILESSSGLPKLIKAHLDDYRRDGYLTGTSSATLAGYYHARIEEMWKRNPDDIGSGNAIRSRAMALLATTRQGAALHEGSLRWLIESMQFPLEPSIELGAELGRAAGLLEESRTTRWRFSDPTLAAHVVTHPRLGTLIEAAQRSWAVAERLWADPSVPLSLHQFLARNLVPMLEERDDTAKLLELAQDDDFLAFQVQHRPKELHVGCDTLLAAARAALREENLISATSLGLKHARRIELPPDDTIVASLTRSDYDCALALAKECGSRELEALAILSIAASLRVHGNPRARSVLDNHLSRAGMLRFKFDYGAGTCAVILLSILCDQPARVFQWRRALQAFRSDQKLLLPSLLVVRHQFSEAFEVLQSEQPSERAEKQLKELITHRARQEDGPEDALCWVDKFSDPELGAWTAAELTAIFVEMGLRTGRRPWFEIALRAEQKIKEMQRLGRKGESAHEYPIRQLTKSRVARARARFTLEDRFAASNILHRAEEDIRRFQWTAFSEIRQLRTRGKVSRRQPPHEAHARQVKVRANMMLDATAKSFVICATGYADCENMSSAQRCWQRAFRLHRKLVEFASSEKGAGTHAKHARRMVAFVGELARSAPFESEGRVWLDEALSELEEALHKSDDYENKNDCRLRVATRLSSMGLFDLAQQQYGKIGPGNLRAELLARMCADHTRLGGQCIETAKTLDDRLLSAGNVALYLIQEGRDVAAINHIMTALPFRKRNKSANVWGVPCVGAEIASILFRRGERETANRIFGLCIQSLSRLSAESRALRTADIAHALKACGQHARAMRLIESAIHAQRRLHTVPKLAALLLYPRNFWAGEDCTIALAICNSQPNHLRKVEAAAQMMLTGAEWGFEVEVRKLAHFAKVQASRIKGGDRDSTRDRWNAHGSGVLGFCRAACVLPQLTNEAEAWYDAVAQEVSTYKAQAGSRRDQAIPATLRQAQALLWALKGRWEEAAKIAGGIWIAEDRSDAFRHLVLLAIRSGRAWSHLMDGILDKPHTHYPKILEALARMGRRDDVIDLAPRCFGYSDSAYRAVAAMIQLFQPDNSQLEVMWNFCQSFESSQSKQKHVKPMEIHSEPLESGDTDEKEDAA